MAKLLFDLNQPVQYGMSFFPGDPVPLIDPAEGVEPPWRVTQLHLGTHTGTHIDAASHFIPHGLTIDHYPLSRFLLQGMVVSAGNLAEDEAIPADLFTEMLASMPEGGALLIQTGWDKFWGQERYLHHPYLSEQCVRVMSAAPISLVGIDALNVDSTHRKTTHAHQHLLGNDILIVENLARLNQLTPGMIYSFSFLPLLLPGLDGSPVRAIAWEE